jgi:hypothetical protein
MAKELGEAPGKTSENRDFVSSTTRLLLLFGLCIFETIHRAHSVGMVDSFR